MKEPIVFPEQVEIIVTQEDIDNGIRKSPWECPIAYAVKRVFPNRWVAVLSYEVRVSNKTYNLDNKGIGLRYDFDNYSQCSPCSIILTRQHDWIKF